MPSRWRARWRVVRITETTGMNTDRSTKLEFTILTAALAVLVLSQLLGPKLTDNNWNLIHWQLLPTWYVVAWTGLAVVLLILAWRYGDRLGVLMASRTGAVVSMVALFVIFILCQFDSIVYGGGNLRIAQIGQAERIVFRWYEFGATGFVSVPYQLFKLLGVNVNTAALFAWKTYAFLCTAVTIVGSAVLAGRLTDSTARRAWTFLLLVFGAHTLTLLGFVGVEPILPAASIWLLVFAVKYHETRRVNFLGWMWLVLAIATFTYIGSIYLMPVAALATVARRGQKSFLAPALLSLAVLIVLLAVTYVLAQRSPEIAAQLLFWKGKLPLSDYGLFSWRRIVDLWQMRAVLSPIVVGALLLWLVRIRFKGGFVLLLTLTAAISGAVASSIIDPLDSPPLDLPRIVAYLLPLSAFAAAVFLSLSQRRDNGRILSTAAVLSILSITAVTPSFVRLSYAEPYLTTYFDKQTSYYRVGGLALRDAYFERRDFTRANYWDQALPVKSDDYLNYRGCLDLAAKNESDDAARILTRTVAGHPYWTEPRSLLAICDVALGRLPQAKPHIDTCLMLDPYKKEHQMNLYRWYFAKGDRAQAAVYLEYIQSWFPHSHDVLSEIMMNWLAEGRAAQADSLATVLIARDTMLALPYLAKGRLAEARGDIAAALAQYQRFMVFGKYRPEAASVGRKITELRQESVGTEP